jgi:BirA family biotin operon repressor/biotin-[acetyl-CoA-carboxylase] ligase
VTEKRITEKLKSAFLCHSTRPDKLFFFHSTDSTNERAKRYPLEVCHDEEIDLGADSGASLFIADSQSAGRGRLGRSFVSNGGAGIYMSFRFTTDAPLSRVVAITPFAAVAVCRATEALCGIPCDIKWVNDVYVRGKKLAGILTESSICPDGKAAVICGIGINVKRSAMPPEVASIATSLEDHGAQIDPCELMALIAEEFIGGFKNPLSSETVAEYKRRSFLTGKRVRVISPSGEYSATVTGITDSYELCITTDSGEAKSLSTGEVSLKFDNIS